MSQPAPLFVKAIITPSEVTALQAMSVSHQRVRILSGVRLTVSAIIAAAGAVVTLSALPATWVTVAGALWAGAYSIGLASWLDGELLRAAKLQEMFEVELFQLPWNTVIAGPQVRWEDASRLSKKFKSQRIADEWDKVPNLPRPFDVLARQIQNLGWRSRICRRYANVVLGIIVAWTVAGLAVGIIGGFTIGEIILRWFVPSLGGLLLGIDTFRQQRAIAKERDRVCTFAEDEALRAARRVKEAATEDALLALSRQVQDALFSTRSRAPRAPSRLFYVRYYRGDEVDFRAPVQRLATALAGQPAP
ncbi:S-4TM family putative pore-forming effector [Micromonospora echinofusca]|uniref:SMODS and SLOG-associating 2TM effector domain-containing protein n=1 Tax=Micromonospora echinofusca TaxID=47858 RepID=A0ABS3VK38_MICEH|nr:S-4TM family putative pore-forming effector [Micromonospora echinofusca]MBO4204887.1 hypothetical protein [Micromonospora echinofusca]